MNVLVLDSIHGGVTLAFAYKKAGHSVDVVDVYRNSTGVDMNIVEQRSYDLIVAPVHLDPDHPLVRLRNVPVISHHEAVRRLLASNTPHPMVEITGARGKTTTAHALAALLQGPGVLHTSSGLVVYPQKHLLTRMSITPASVLAAAGAALETGGWLVAEESLGVTGAGDLSLVTSSVTYPCAAGKKDALKQKLASLEPCRKILLAPGVPCDKKNAVHLDDVATVNGTECRIELNGAVYRFSSSLLVLEAYRVPLMMAGTAACLLGLDPTPLRDFSGVEGRLSVERKGNVLIIDNANSGTCADTTVAAARYARQYTGSEELTLVIGTEPGAGKVCDGFPEEQIASTVREIRPQRLVLVGTSAGTPVLPPDCIDGVHVFRAQSYAQGKAAAISASEHGSIVLAVKTWR